MSDYGFLYARELPEGDFIAKTIEHADEVDWAVMDEFNHIAGNHCGATAVYNMALYFSKCGLLDILQDKREDTFAEIYRIVGPGPKFTIAEKAKKYMAQKGCEIKHQSVKTFGDMKAAVDAGHPCGLLLAESLISWHWVTCIGYREYESGENYLEILDGWNKNIRRFYKINSGSKLLGGSEYYAECD